MAEGTLEAQAPQEVISKSEELLELIAVELAHARTRSAEIVDVQTLQSFEEIINQKQRTLNIFPVQMMAKRLGITVSFFYRNWANEIITPSPLALKNELEGKVWQDPLLSTKLLEAKEGLNKTVRVVRNLSVNYGGPPQSVASYTEPEYVIPF